MGIEESMRRAGDEVGGRAKEAWGDLTDNERLEAEGRAQHTGADRHVTENRFGDDRVEGDRLDDTRVDHLNDDVAYDPRATTGDDGTLRDALRDDMGQDQVRDVHTDVPGTPGDDGTLRDSLRDDMGQGLHSNDDPITGDLRDDPRRDQI